MGVGVLRPICGYEGLYSVSDNGEVFSHISSKWLKPSLMNNGYKTVELFSNGKSKRVLVHRLVAKAFLDNPNGLPFVNHKDENRGNNSVENLEWCTATYNQNYGTCQERKHRSMQRYWKSEKHRADKRAIGQRTKEILGKRVIQKTIDGKVVGRFISINEATRQTGIRHISDACNRVPRNKYGYAGGYMWDFETGE